MVPCIKFCNSFSSSMLFPFWTASLSKTFTSLLTCASFTFLAKISSKGCLCGKLSSVMNILSYIQSFLCYYMISDSESSLSYSSEEVLWAKIQGYPWWPAFVDQVHREEDGRIEYTVNFFGDYTHSRLAASKLNKFQEHYAEHYPKARTHRPLMTSLQMAEQKLRENEQDVHVFRQIRDQLKQKRRWGVTRWVPGGDRLSSPEGSEKSQPLPQLRNAVTSTCNRTRSQAKVEKVHDEREGESSKERTRRSLSGPGCRIERKKPENSRRFAEDGKEPYGENQQMAGEDNEGPVSIEQQLSQDISKMKDILKNPPRKRGRPRKNAIPQSEIPTPLPVRPDPKRKISSKGAISKKVSSLVTRPSLSEEDSLIIERVRQLLQDREALIDYLSTVAITPLNVQEVLELGVVQVLREGDSSRQATGIIALLMNVLMLKYFPNDGKQKTAEKATRKRRKPIVFMEDQPEQSEGREVQAGLSGEDCRKKTIVKLQKFLARQPELPNRATSREFAIKIEAMFARVDSSIGHRYKSLALKVLRALREGAEAASEVMRKLEGNEYD